MDTTRIGITSLALGLLALASVCHAATIDIYTENLDAFDATQDLGDGVFYAVQTIPEGSSPFNDGNAIRMFDFSTDDKPELQGELAAPLLEPFRIDFQSFDNSPTDSSKAIRFHIANTGDSITSEGRTATSLSWQSDGEFTAKYGGIRDGNPNDADTLSSEPLVGVQDITMVANGAIAGTYSYSLFGESRTLDPLHFDIYINGELLNASDPNSTDPDEQARHVDYGNGLAFHVERSAGDYDPALGIQRFGLVGSSNSDINPDVLFDNIILRTGADIAIPEPATFTLLFSCLALLAHRRR